MPWSGILPLSPGQRVTLAPLVELYHAAVERNIHRPYYYFELPNPSMYADGPVRADWLASLYGCIRVEFDRSSWLWIPSGHPDQEYAENGGWILTTWATDPLRKRKNIEEVIDLPLRYQQPGHRIKADDVNALYLCLRQFRYRLSKVNLFEYMVTRDCRDTASNASPAIFPTWESAAEAADARPLSELEPLHPALPFTQCVTVGERFSNQAYQAARYSWRIRYELEFECPPNMRLHSCVVNTASCIRVRRSNGDYVCIPSVRHGEYRLSTPQGLTFYTGVIDGNYHLASLVGASASDGFHMTFVEMDCTHGGVEPVENESSRVEYQRSIVLQELGDTRGIVLAPHNWEYPSQD